MFVWATNMRGLASRQYVKIAFWGGDQHQAISENGSAAWSAKKKKKIFSHSKKAPEYINLHPMDYSKRA